MWTNSIEQKTSVAIQRDRQTDRVRCSDMELTEIEIDR